MKLLGLFSDKEIYEVMVHMIWNASEKDKEELTRLQKEDGWKIGGQMTFKRLHIDSALYVPLKRKIKK